MFKFSSLGSCRTEQQVLQQPSQVSERKLFVVLFDVWLASPESISKDPDAVTGFRGVSIWLIYESKSTVK